MLLMVPALIGLLAVPLYFLLLMADGRKLGERLRDRQAERAKAVPEEGEPLIASDRRSWLAPPYRMREDTPSAWPPL
jgi:hypothetical protein